MEHEPAWHLPQGPGSARSDAYAGSGASTRTPSPPPTLVSTEPRLAPACSPHLPGSPAQPFHTRLALKFYQRSLRVDALLLVAIVTFIARMLPHAPPGALTWALLHVAGTFAAMALGHACNLGLADNWRLRWHVLELLTLCVRSCDLGLGGGICAAMHATIVQRHAQQQPAPSAAPGGGAWAAAFSAVRFVSASGAGHLALHMSVLRLPPGLSAVAQLINVRQLLPHFRAFCQPGGAMAQPHLLQGGRSAYAAVHTLMLGTVVPLWNACDRPDGGCAEPGVAPAAVECQVLLTWLLLGLSVALPLLVEVASTARLFRLHERQRAAAGLPPVVSMRAAFLRGAGWLLLEDDTDKGQEEGAAERGYAFSGMVWFPAHFLLSVAWDAAVWLVHRPGA